MAELPAHKDRETKLVTSNRKARHDYSIVESFEAGIALVGTEVKSLRAGKCNLQDSYATFEGPKDTPELWLIGAHINPYEHGTSSNHDPRRKRKLLLKRRELGRLKRKVEEKGLTIVPLSVYFSGPYAKVELGLVRGKRQYDKRQTLKKREEDRRLREVG